MGAAVDGEVSDSGERKDKEGYAADLVGRTPPRSPLVNPDIMPGGKRGYGSEGSGGRVKQTEAARYSVNRDCGWRRRRDAQARGEERGKKKKRENGGRGKKIIIK